MREEEFLGMKIRELLEEFIEKPEKTRELLDEFYKLSSTAYNSQGKMSKGFKFLQNLGSNYLFWMDKEYLKTNYGKKWQLEYKKCKEEVPFYHSQLKPIAENILQALKDKKIEIKEQGLYTITECLRNDFESDVLFKIKHKAGGKNI